jgi:[ribosomal protein S5]-alanine N-acetyltransferase
MARANPVRIRAPAASDAKPVLAAVARSRRLHGRWVSAPRTPSEFAAYLRRSQRRSQRAFLVLTPNGAPAGVININEIVRGSFCSGYLGYYAFAPHHRQGYMTLGLALVIERAFSRLGLHRLEANIQPGNAASRRLLRRLKFRREGYSERYLRIAGKWRDHERWALTAEDWTRDPSIRVRRARSARTRSSSRSGVHTRRSET